MDIDCESDRLARLREIEAEVAHLRPIHDRLKERHTRMHREAERVRQDCKRYRERLIELNIEENKIKDYKPIGTIQP